MNNYTPPFEITTEMLAKVSTIMEKIGQITSIGNLDRFPILRKQNRVKSIHASCYIEANSLSIDEVNDIINGVNVVGPQKDITEIKNAIAAYEQLGKFDPLLLKNLKSIHGILGKDIIKPSGQFKPKDIGIIDEHGNVVFIAPPAKQVDDLMIQLFKWIKDNYSKIHPLVLSSVFHYEFVFIHPFADGNGRMVRLWQTALLGKWRPLFYYLPVENFIKNNQQAYYKAISDSHSRGDSNIFIIFMLEMIDNAIDELIKESVLNKEESPYIKRLLSVMSSGVYYSANEILSMLGLKSKETLRKNYLNPAIKKGLVTLEFPNKRTSKNQRYKKI